MPHRHNPDAAAHPPDFLLVAQEAAAAWRRHLGYVHEGWPSAEACKDPACIRAVGATLRLEDAIRGVQRGQAPVSWTADKHEDRAAQPQILVGGSAVTDEALEREDDAARADRLLGDAG